METLMKFIGKKLPCKTEIRSVIGFVFFACLVLFGNAEAQSPELQKTTLRIGHLWLGMIANGSSTSFDPTSGFFPNDYGVMADGGKYAQAFTGAGIYLTAVHWPNHANHDSVESAAVYQLTNQYLQNGRVTVPLTNYLRYQYPQELINGSKTPTALFGTYNPSYSGFQDHTYDEIAEVVDSTIFGVTVNRKVMVWSQNYNDDYVIADLVFTNISSDTLDSLYISFQETGGNALFSNGNNPVGSFDPTMAWQHYYGGRPGDSMRVFYEYSADDPRIGGDNMGAPVISQRGRLLNPNMSYYAILHASAATYDSTNPSADVDDPLMPKVTYIGVTNRIPYNSADDIYGSKNFNAIRGVYSDQWPMTGEIAGTHHGLNSDELGSDDYTNYVAGAYQSISYRTCSFGPYTFLPGQRIHIVFASGFTGIGYEMGQKIGQQWLDGTLQNPPNMPDPSTGWLPSNFQFPSEATEMDKRKDRWISMGIDSVMLSAWRAKWNYEQGYNIPLAPPPPQTVNIRTYSDSVVINWSDPQAESMPNFYGYRIMRRVSAYDTVSYQPIYDSDSTDLGVSHSFADRTAFYSATVYYYIQAKALIGYSDPNADPTTRGKIMYSSRTLYPNIRSINPASPPGMSLSQIRIVPNPYNINDERLVLEGYPNLRQINFYNLPLNCTIRIYTENGDLVQTLAHPRPGTPASGYDFWNMLTSSQQVIGSGVYIAVFQTPDGGLSYQKFVVVR